MRQGGGGFRSNDFVTALFMMYFAIGNTGKIVPNTKFFTYTIKGKPTIRGNYSYVLINNFVVYIQGSN